MKIATARRKRNKAWKKKDFQKAVILAWREMTREIESNPTSYTNTHGDGMSWTIETLANNYNHEEALKEFGYQYNKDSLDDAIRSFEEEMSEALNEWKPKGVVGQILIESNGDYGDWNVVLFLDSEQVESYAKFWSEKKGLKKNKPTSTKAPKKCPFCGSTSYISMAQHNLLCKCHQCGARWYANDYNEEDEDE